MPPNTLTNMTFPPQSSPIHIFTTRDPNISPNTFQTNTVIAACVMFLAILIAWNLPVLREAISGLKLLTVGLHELSHLIVGLICGGQVVSICIDPNDGGATHVMGLMRTTPRIPRDPYAFPSFAQTFWSPSAVGTLAAGYIGSSLIGFLFVVSTSGRCTKLMLDIVASKVCALVLHIGLLVPILRADHWIAYASIIGCEVILIGLWFGDHGNALRFYVLFVGVMNLFYVVWDYVDERLFDKRNTSDCAQFSELLGWPTSSWFIFWFVYDSLVFTSAIFAGICVFRRTDDQMYHEA
ncbi:uncharacterized protein IL334_004965 [Kwoniella shivajii]|uniref:Peptidase M50B-like-domain-containing protein n=1 Tax=Kwoniella shivajii TaxID=564305 RepID=A0ABZ1D1U0_9TREE|nr:hypothetical protein IL334_004965 [Kwoniella shivajii]